MKSNLKKIKDQDIRGAVREGYGKIAQQGGSCCGPSSCCGNSTDEPTQLAQSVGYTASDLAGLPQVRIPRQGTHPFRARYPGVPAKVSTHSGPRYPLFG